MYYSKEYNLMEFTQPINQPVDVSEWNTEFPEDPYPEGARDKTLLYCPTPAPYNFLIGNRQYLFKRSRNCFPEQYWVEILAHLLGNEMSIPVPQAFVAYDKQQCGALISWFLESNEILEESIPGGDYCQQYIQNFDRKKGTQHNFETIVKIFSDLHEKFFPFLNDWLTYWAKAFVFDALIGNTDRHQDNWSVIKTISKDEKRQLINMRISPVFDNGTSMGYEIAAKKLHLFRDKRLEQYVGQGWHHIKWERDDTDRIGHKELLLKLSNGYPETHQIMLDCLKKVNTKTFETILNYLCAFDVPVRLTHERAAFMLRLLEFRHKLLLNALET
jgi:hypothetical protein